MDLDGRRRRRCLIMSPKHTLTAAAAAGNGRPRMAAAKRGQASSSRTFAGASLSPHWAAHGKKAKAFLLSLTSSLSLLSASPPLLLLNLTGQALAHSSPLTSLGENISKPPLNQPLLSVSFHVPAHISRRGIAWAFLVPLTKHWDILLSWFSSVRCSHRELGRWRRAVWRQEKATWHPLLLYCYLVVLLSPPTCIKAWWRAF